MQMIDYSKLRQELDSLISGYNLTEAVGILKNLDFAQIPGRWRADFAQLARRAHLYKEAIKILQDKVHGVAKPEPKDVIEYASSIRKMGMVQQCLNLLERVPPHKDKFLYQAYCHVHNWDYEKARIDFEKFLLQEGLNEREVMVAHVNIVACCIYLDDLIEAEARLSHIEDICKEKFFQFYLNCLEMRGQICIKKNRLLEASAVLSQAYELSKKEHGTTSLFIEKWKILAELPLPSSLSLEGRIAAFKKAIRIQGHWETLRDFDFQVAVVQNDKDLLNHVYFGTPFESFKKRISKNHAGSLTKTYGWAEKKSGTVPLYHLDPFDCEMELAPFGLIQHRLLLVLLSDFYRPWSLQRMFDSLFPDEIYDVDSSPKRIYGLIKKLQDSLKALALPFELKSTIHGYRFRHLPGGTITIYSQMACASHEEILRYALENKYVLREFTPQELAQTLSISSHKAYRWISDMEASGLVARDGRSHRLILKAS